MVYCLFLTYITRMSIRLPSLDEQQQQQHETRLSNVTNSQETSTPARESCIHHLLLPPLLLLALPLPTPLPPRVGRLTPRVFRTGATGVPTSSSSSSSFPLSEGLVPFSPCSSSSSAGSEVGFKVEARLMLRVEGWSSFSFSGSFVASLAASGVNWSWRRERRFPRKARVLRVGFEPRVEVGEE